MFKTHQFVSFITSVFIWSQRNTGSSFIFNKLCTDRLLVTAAPQRKPHTEDRMPAEPRYTLVT